MPIKTGGRFRLTPARIAKMDERLHRPAGGCGEEDSCSSFPGVRSGAADPPSGCRIFSLVIQPPHSRHTPKGFSSLASDPGPAGLRAALFT